MGRMNAIGFAASVAEGQITLDAALSWHLSANHYPPVPSSMIEPCKRAIEAANEGEWDRAIELPEGVSYRGESTAPASAIIEQHHLDSFLSVDDDE